MNMDAMSLNGQWSVEGVSPEGDKLKLCGAVPGCNLDAVLNLHNDKDIFYRDNAEHVQKYENYDWVYTKEFELNITEKKYELVFERLDTYCDIFLNDIHIAYCENGFISYRFDVSNAIQNGKNILKVYFYSPVLRDRGKKPRKFWAFSKDRMYTRRMQCTYGWDWAMRFVTCGIGDTYIEPVTDKLKVKKVYAYTKSIDEDCAEIITDIDFSYYEGGGIVSVELYDPDGGIECRYSRYNEECFMRVSMDVANPKLWFPNGYGDANLYKLVVKHNDNVLYTTMFGIRTVKIMQLADKMDDINHNKCLEIKKSDFAHRYDKNTDFSGFILKVNGEKIMCKGANWVPCMPFAIADTHKKITRILTLAKEAGLNIIRVWGGGAFESEHFYDECSRLGIMVIQDFLMACGDYPEEQEWFLENLRKEAQYAVKLIRNKPCLVWWNGDNENAVDGTNNLKWYHGRNSAYKAIAPVIYEEDYMRSFLPSSPFGGELYASNTVGTTHNTQFLGFLFKYIENTDMDDFKEKLKQFRARFIAEEPVMGAASVSSLRRFMTDEDIVGDDMSMWLYHTKNNPSLKKELFEYELLMAEKLFGSFTDGYDRFFKLKYLQYEWMRLTLEQVRREKWFSSGIIYWMLNDCWPAASGWAMIDYYCQPKASYYSFKRAAKAIIGSIDYNDGIYSLHVCNDSKAQNVRLRCFTLSGRELIAETRFEAAANSSLVAYEIKDVLKDGDIIFFEITDDSGICDRTFYMQGKLKMEPCDTEIIEKAENHITVKANKYVHAVELESEAVFEDNYFSLLPGEIRRINYYGSSDISVQGYTVK